jgi:hypothetical protein
MDKMQQHISRQGIGSAIPYPFSYILEKEEAFIILDGKNKTENY